MSPLNRLPPIHLARGLAAVNTLVDVGLVGVGQAIFDEPSRARRWRRWIALGAVGGAVYLATDLVWTRATRERTEPLDPSVLSPAHETDLTARQLAVSAIATPVWLLGRGVPERLRQRGIDRPNTVLAVPLALAFAAGTGPGWFRHAQARAAQVL